MGSIIGVKLITETFPEVGHGPRLNVDIHRGALTEGLLAFAIVFVSLGLAKKDPNSFFIKTWITSVSKLSLQILGSDLTGGLMNPASVSTFVYFFLLFQVKVAECYSFGCMKIRAYLLICNRSLFFAREDSELTYSQPLKGNLVSLTS